MVCYECQIIFFLENSWYLLTYIQVLNSLWKLFDRYEGFNVDLVQAISEILGFNYTMSEVRRTLVDY